jgi:hypothetical protein
VNLGERRTRDWRLRRTTRLAEDGAITAHCHMPGPGDPHREAAGVFDASFSNPDLEAEIKYSASLARRVLSALMSENDGISHDVKNLSINRTVRISRSDVAC